MSRPMQPEPFNFVIGRIPEDSKAEVDPTTLEQVAVVWDEEISRILQRMIVIGQEQRNFAPEIGPAAYELVMIGLFLTPKVIEKHLSDRSLKDIDPATEHRALDTPERKERIEQTARNLAKGIWIPLLDKWRDEVVKINAEVQPTVNISRGQRPSTTRNHYSPKFANRLWADSQGNIMVYSSKPGDAVEARVRDFGQWGFEERLYSQGLELYLGGLETDAAEPIRKLLEVIPLSAQERKQLITFLIAQWIRTPVFILTQMSGLQRIIRERGIKFGTDVQSLRRVFEASFQNDVLYAMLYRTIDLRSWRILVAPGGEGFIRPDSSIVIGGRDTNIYYPLTSEKCLHIGPDLAGERPPIIPLLRQLTSNSLARTNAILASVAFKSAMASVQFDSPGLRSLLSRWLGSSKLVQDARRSAAFRYWEPLRPS
jgi:hypothetical protein